MKFSPIRSRVLAFCLGFLPIMASHAITPLDIADSPISVSVAPKPNVMLLLDSSYSMRNLNWPTDFSPKTKYDLWCGNCTKNDRWEAADPFLNTAEINKGFYRYYEHNAGSHQCTAPATPAGTGIPVMGVSKTNSDIIRCLYIPDGTYFVITGNYLNYLFSTYGTTHEYDTTSAKPGTQYTSRDLTVDVLGKPIIPRDYRVDSVSRVIKDNILTINGVKFGLAKFNGGSGADVLADCGSNEPDIGDPIDYGAVIDSDYKPNDSTPLASALYEMTRYFRGMKSFTNGSKHKSPITSACQSNFTIVLTDGLSAATADLQWPENSTENTQKGDPELCGSGKVTCDGNTAPDWDNEHPTEPDVFAPFEKFSDGSFIDFPSTSEDGKRIFVDDVALFAYDIDMKTGGSYDDEPYAQQNMRTVTVGFGLDVQALKDAAYYGNGSKTDSIGENDSSFYFNANNEQELTKQLTKAINDIKLASQISSSSSVAASTGYYVSGSSLYQGLFNSENWTGHLKQYPINDDGSVGTAKLDAAEVLDTTYASSADSRKIFSYDPVGKKGITFDTNTGGLTDDQQKSLGNQFVIDYLRGNRTCEAAKGNTADCTDTVSTPNITYAFRDRENLLGPIVNSSPLFIPVPSSIYPDDWGTGSPETDACTADAGCYSHFKTDNSARKEMIYVGANDGMLHAFNAESLEEVFAYVPDAIIPKLGAYADPSHTHKFYVDGTPTVIDAYDSTKGWRTILVGSLNKGGQGIFALDITDVGNGTSTLTKEDVLWEFTDSYIDPDDANKNGKDLGYTYSRPAIIRMHNGKWVAVFGNGYNNTEDDGFANTTGYAVLYFVDLFTGKLLHSINTEKGLAADPANDITPYSQDNSRPNGLSGVTPIDINSDMIADYIYAGDIYGNMWRFDVTSATESNWSIYGKGSGPSAKEPIFVARHTSNPQSITTRPVVARASHYGIMLYFGTGSYLGIGDIKNTEVQTFYGLLDDPEGDDSKSTVETNLTKQSFETEKGVTFDKQSQDVRHYSSNASAGAYKSWYINLIEDTTAEGERVISTPVVRGAHQKRIIFVSIIPDANSCNGGGRSWLTELDARNGNATTEPVFDLSYDGKLSSLDNGTNEKIYNGWSQEGIQSTPTIIISGDKENKYMSNSKGGITNITEALPAASKGRQSWRQIK